MLNRDVLNLLGLAICSKNLVTGDNVLKNIRNQKACLVIVSEDASANTKKQLLDKCSYYGIECIIKGDSYSISKAIGKNNRVAVAILDKNFADKIKEKIG